MKISEFENSEKIKNLEISNLKEKNKNLENSLKKISNFENLKKVKNS